MIIRAEKSNVLCGMFAHSRTKGSPVSEWRLEEEPVYLQGPEKGTVDRANAADLSPHLTLSLRSGRRGRDSSVV